MSTSPDNHLVNVLSHWLARHVDDAELSRELETVETSRLGDEQALAVAELRAELANGHAGGDLEMVVREALEAIALG
jgi:hypothetical protein